MSARQLAEPGHIPTSIILKGLLNEGGAERVSIEWLLSHLGQRSFGVVIFFLGLIALVPGASGPVGVLIAIPAFQMLLARRDPALPGFVRRRLVSKNRLAKLVGRVVPPVLWIERYVRPRWATPAIATKRWVGGVALVLGLTLVSPFPFSHVIPAVVIMLTALAYLEEDGLVLALAGFAALTSLAITSATVWAGIAGGGWIEGIL